MAEETLIDTYERQVKAASELYVKQHKALRQALGDRPYRHQHIKPDEQIADYLANRDNVEFWTGYLNDERNGRMPEIRRLSAIAYALKMESFYYKANLLETAGQEGATI